LVPFGQPPHREATADPGAEHRFALCRAGTAGDERLDVLRAEIDRPGASYTVDTLRELRDQSGDDELFLVIGADEAAALPSWREPEEVLRLARIAVAPREGVADDDVRRALARLRGGDGVSFFTMPGIDISSTMVRDRVAQGEPIRYLVPRGIEEYIAKHGLYRDGRDA
jgi:nicotinate-nucleotide adenylyltransferase